MEIGLSNNFKRITNVLSYSDSKSIDSFYQNEFNITGIQLMGMASLSFYNLTKDLYKESSSIIILCGKGNNGGDGYALAYFLYTEGLNPILYFWEEPIAQEASFYFELIKKVKLESHKISYGDTITKNWNSQSIVVDAILGVGVRYPLDSELEDHLMEINNWKINNSNSLFISIDAVTGRKPWQEWESYSKNKSSSNIGLFPADLLAEIGSLKWENFGFPNDKKIYIPIGFPIYEFEKSRTEKFSRIFKFEKMDSDNVIKFLKKTPNSHKYSAGSCAFNGGEESMEGAILISLSAFLGLGGGIAKCFSNSSRIFSHPLAVDPSYMIDTKSSFWTDPYLLKAQTIVWGPGTKPNSEPSEKFHEAWDFIKLHPDKKIILDAGRIPSNDFVQSDIKLNPNCVLTPHFGEFQRLTGIQSENWVDRIEAGLKISMQLNACILLKESYSILFCPDQALYIWDSPNPKLATMGTGDLLTGILAVFLSRGYSIVDSVHYALSLIAKSSEMITFSPTTWEILEYLKKAGNGERIS
jgi:hydroxyethylthiazole kinase-like uncharacterized protein yjeF